MIVRVSTVYNVRVMPKIKEELLSSKLFSYTVLCIGFNKLIF